VIAALFLEVLPHGGVQRFGRHMTVALSSVAAGDGIAVLSLNDPRGEHVVTVGGEKAVISGFGGRRGAFIVAALQATRRADLLVVGHPYLAPIATIGRALRWAPPYVVIAYGIEVWRQLRPDRRHALRNARSVIAISEYTAEAVAKLQEVDMERISLLSPALDPDIEAAAAARDGSPGRAPVLLTVARLAKEGYKGVDQVLRALPTVRTRFPDVRYHVVGDGDARPELELLVAELGLQEHVTFAGHVSSAELTDAYASARVFVMPSAGEGFGMVLVEAMAFGVPAVAGRHGGSQEVVTDGVDGFLVEHANVEAIARVIMQALDEREWPRLSEGARRTARQYSFPNFQRQVAAAVGRGDA
jgi:phosphatidyl-myo-inositol dimannoside synthase